MNLEVGDIVELIDDKGELKIISLISVNEILVEDEFGLQYKLDAEKVLKKTDSTIEFKVKEAPKFKNESERKFTFEKDSPYIDTFKFTKKSEAEIDLHLHEILPDDSSFDKYKALELQIRLFNKAIERAKNARLKYLNVIHGYGEGILRYEVRKRLKDAGFEFMDSAYGSYGQGATKVFL